MLAENKCNFGIHRELGIPRSSLWTFVDDMEKQTNLRLVVRRKRHNTLTEEGEKFLPYAKQILGLFDKGVREAAEESQGEPSGEVLISTTHAIASTFLMPSIKTFQRNYPGITLKVIADDYISSSTEWMADIILRPIEHKEHLEKKWHFTYEHALFASPAYLQQNGVPEKGEDLHNHSMIGYGEHTFSYFPDIDWHLKGRWGDLPRLTPSLTINSTVSIYLAAVEGIGICSATLRSNLFYQGSLVRVLPYIDGPVVHSYFCTKRSMGTDLRRNVAIFQNFFEQYLNDLGVQIDLESEYEGEEDLRLCQGG